MDSLKSILDNLRLRVVKDCSITMVWDEVVDAGIARHTEAIKINKGTLHVAVRSSVWAQELTFLKAKIIANLNERLGPKTVADIKFKVKGSIREKDNV